MSKKRVVIVAGGDLDPKDMERVNPDTDWIIGVDGGAKYLLEQGIDPDCLVGDFDTLDASFMEQLSKKRVQMRRLPVEKDQTDTHYACEIALLHQPEELILLGVWGGARVDHALANISLLEWLLDQEVKAVIYSGTNRIRMIQGPFVTEIQKSEYDYLSLLPVTKQVRGIYTKGLKYTLTNGTLIRGTTLGISNELIDEKGIIQMEKGKMLLIESSDRLF